MRRPRPDKPPPNAHARRRRPPCRSSRARGWRAALPPSCATTSAAARSHRACRGAGAGPPFLLSHPPSDRVKFWHPCRWRTRVDPRTLAASILAGSPTQLEPLTFQTTPLRNLETPLLISGHRCAPPPLNPLAHPCGPSTLAAWILAGSPTQLEPLTFQTSRFARNLETLPIIFPFFEAKNESVALSTWP